MRTPPLDLLTLSFKTRFPLTVLSLSERQEANQLWDQLRTSWRHESALEREDAAMKLCSASPAVQQAIMREAALRIIEPQYIRRQNPFS